MCNCGCLDAIVAVPRLAVAALPPVPVRMATAAPFTALAAAQVPITVVISEVRIGVVRVDDVIVGGGGGGPCPHMTALMDAYNQPIRESATGFVILVETHP